MVHRIHRTASALPAHHVPADPLTADAPQIATLPHEPGRCDPADGGHEGMCTKDVESEVKKWTDAKCRIDTASDWLNGTEVKYEDLTDCGTDP